MQKAAKDLKPGDLVDLEGDSIADTGDDPSLEFEYAEVDSIVWETPNCVRVDFTDHPSVGFPPEHLVVIQV